MQRSAAAGTWVCADWLSFRAGAPLTMHYIPADAALPPQLRELLLNPDWLRRKLMAAGTTAVVADFRR